jgi:hypothetical protein
MADPRYSDFINVRGDCISASDGTAFQQATANHVFAWGDLSRKGRERGRIPFLVTKETLVEGKPQSAFRELFRFGQERRYGSCDTLFVASDLYEILITLTPRPSGKHMREVTDNRRSGLRRVEPG